VSRPVREAESWLTGLVRAAAALLVVALAIYWSVHLVMSVLGPLVAIVSAAGTAVGAWEWWQHRRRW
jgi:hypothetical protein